MDASNRTEILTLAREQIGRLSSMLAVQEADLSSARTLAPQVRDSGLAMVRAVLQRARQLATETDRSLLSGRSAQDAMQ